MKHVMIKRIKKYFDDRDEKNIAKKLKKQIKRNDELAEDNRRLYTYYRKIIKDKDDIIQRYRKILKHLTGGDY